MFFLTRKIKVKYCGEADHQPKDMPDNSFVPVIGIQTKAITFMKDGKPEQRENLNFLCITKNGKFTSVAAFNCSILIDEKAELDINAAVELLKNATLMGKVLSEKISTISSNQNPEGN